jgi:large subunit ribosomal protein L10
MNKEQKTAVVDEIAAQISDADAIFAVDYRGTSVPQAAALRAKLRDADTTFRIVKNSLTERAADKAGADTLKELLEGPTAFAFVRGDAAAAAKALNDFTRELDTFQFKGGVLDGEPLSVDEIKAIARLPTREVLHAQLVGVVASPLTGLVRGLNGLISGLAVQLQQIAEQGLIEGDQPAPEPEGVKAHEPEAGARAEDAEAEAPAEESDAEAPAEKAEAETPVEDTPAEDAAADEPTAEEAEAEAPADEPEAEPAPEEASTDEDKE